jgi:hypothetical protein
LPNESQAKSFETDSIPAPGPNNQAFRNLIIKGLFRAAYFFKTKLVFGALNANSMKKIFIGFRKTEWCIRGGLK